MSVCTSLLMFFKLKGKLKNLKTVTFRKSKVKR